MNRKLRMLVCLSLLILPLAALAAPKAETRCGWFDNPTPGNAWLTDAAGEWIIGTQGGHQAEGDWPEFKASQWVHTNGGSYGHGCACITGTFNAENHSVAIITKAKAKPLSACRKDKTLKEPA